MVKVQMRVQQMLHLQVVRRKIFLDVSPFILVRTAAIDDDTFLCFIAHHIAVLTKRIYLKSLDCHSHFLLAMVTCTTFFVLKYSSSKKSLSSHTVAIFFIEAISPFSSPP